MRKKKQPKIAKVISEFKAGSLRSGSKTGPRVKNRKQAVAIAMSEAGKSKRGKGMSVAQFERKNKNKRLDSY